MDQYLVDIPLSLPMYSALCGHSITADQLQYADPSFHQNLNKIKSMDAGELAAMDFDFEEFEEFGRSAQEAVTLENRDEYCTLMATKVLNTRVHRQLKAMIEGVDSCFPVRLLLMICQNKMSTSVVEVCDILKYHVCRSTGWQFLSLEN